MLICNVWKHKTEIVWYIMNPSLKALKVAWIGIISHSLKGIVFFKVSKLHSRFCFLHGIVVWRLQIAKKSEIRLKKENEG